MENCIKERKRRKPQFKIINWDQHIALSKKKKRDLTDLNHFNTVISLEFIHQRQADKKSVDDSINKQNWIVIRINKQMPSFPYKFYFTVDVCFSFYEKVYEKM